MVRSQLSLLATRRLLPLFTTQFLSALNDNLFKNALVILIAYRTATSAKATEILVTVATALFILPYFLFSATAGQLADKFEKQRLVRIVKLWEIVVMLVAAVGFATNSVAFQLSVLFCLGVQATFFGPVKYGILPELLPGDELLAGNALIEAGTFLAILIGTIAGGLLILVPRGAAIVSLAQLSIALAGWAVSLWIPRGRPAAPDLALNPNIAAETWAILRHVARRRALLVPLLGISWFWLVGVAYLAQFPNYAKVAFGGNNQVVTLFLTLFSIGIGVGSMLCGRLQRGAINARLVPVGALALAIFGFDIAFYGGDAMPRAGLVGAAAFLAAPQNWRVVFDLFAIALAGGVYCVPLYAIMQVRSEEQQRARVIAANNIMNAGFMVFAGAASTLMLAAGWGVGGIFLAIAVGNAGVAGAAYLYRREEG